jgi:hypothetical protein
MQRQRFINFTNVPTFQFLCWVRSGGLGDVKELIGKAFDMCEGDFFYKGGITPCLVARDKLAGILEERLGEVPGVESAGVPYVDEFVMEVDTDLEYGLLWPILAWAMSQVNYRAVALALLVEAGKWNPEEPEDLFPLPDDKKLN